MLTEHLQGSGQIVIPDNWFSSIESSKTLIQKWFYSIMLVVIAFKDFPRVLLRETEMELGQWTLCTIKGVKE